MQRTRRTIAAMLLALLASPGCLPNDEVTRIATNPGVTVAAYTGARLVGTVRGPAELISNNAGSLISNNSGSLVSNNAGGYRVQAFTEVPLAQALLYLTTPDERFYLDETGKAITTQTDASGSYRFHLAPVSAPVIVSAMLSGNRRLVGYMKPTAGDNTVDVSVATTCVTEFLRKKAREQGDAATMASYDLAKLAELTTLTQAMLDAGRFAVDPAQDLVINNLPNLVGRYAVAMVMNADPALKQAWEALLGVKLVALSTVTNTNIPAGFKPYSIAADSRTSATKPGDAYVSSYTGTFMRVDRMKPDGTVATVSVGYRSPTFSGNYLYKPRGMAVAPDGKLYFADADRTNTSVPGSPTVPHRYIYRFDPASGATDSLTITTSSAMSKPFGLTFDPDGNLYIADYTKNSIFKITKAQLDANTAFAPTLWVGANSTAPAFAGDGGPIASASFATPTDVVYYNNALYVSDCGNHRIRKVTIDASGSASMVTTVAGSGPDATNSIVTNGGFGGDGGAATSARLNYPKKVLFDASGRMFIADGDNNRIRVVDNGVIRTLAGIDPARRDASATDGEAKDVWLGIVESMAWDANGNLLLTDLKSVRRLWLQGGF